MLLAFCCGSLSCFRTHNLGLSFLTLHVHSKYTRCPLLKLIEKKNHHFYLSPKEFGVCQHAVSLFCIFPSVEEPAWFVFHGTRYCLTCRGWGDQIVTRFWMAFFTLLLPSTLSLLMNPGCNSPSVHILEGWLIFCKKIGNRGHRSTKPLEIVLTFNIYNLLSEIHRQLSPLLSLVNVQYVAYSDTWLCNSQSKLNGWWKAQRHLCW